MFVAAPGCGLLLSLYVGWRIAQSYTKEIGNVLRLWTPWASLVAGLYAAGIWLLAKCAHDSLQIHVDCREHDNGAFLILGGGFAGAYTALHLDKLLGGVSR
jgi:hypothetical protein